MIKKLGQLSYRISNIKQQKKLLGQKIKYLQEMKPYIVPYIHHDKKVTNCLMKSYGLLALSKLCFFGGPFFIKMGINSLSAVSAAINPIFYFLGFGICYTGSVFFEQKRNLTTSDIIQIAMLDTASKVYKRMLSLGPEFYFKGSQRHVLFNLSKSQSALEQNLKSFTQYFLPVILDISLSIALLLYYSNPLFAASLLTCYGTYAVFTINYSQKRRASIRQFRQSQKHIDFVTSQTFSNYFNVKYFQKQEAELNKYKKALENYYSRNYTIQESLGTLNTIQRFIFGTGLTFNMMLAAYYTQLGLLTIGDIMMIQTLMLQFLSPLFILGSMFRSFQDNIVDINKINDMMLLPYSVKEGNIDLKNIQGRIQFKDVNFRYIKDSKNILDKMNFIIQPNRFVAIVGRSGIGKSTILNLIFRLYDPIDGTIEIDGQNIKNLNFDFRKEITIVSQTPYIFNGSVMENLKYGNPQASNEEVMILTKRLNLHQIIMKLPQGYNEPVGEKGNIFSGGEKQRISLIRALLRKTKFLLLDEPTSSVDIETQLIIGKILSQQKDRTRVMITHREGILQFCDETIRIE